MYYTSTLTSILEVVLLILPALLSVAFVTVAERKTMASMQRRLGPNVVGYYGLLQAFADALKLLLKVTVFSLSKLRNWLVLTLAPPLELIKLMPVYWSVRSSLFSIPPENLKVNAGTGL